MPTPYLENQVVSNKPYPRTTPFAQDLIALVPALRAFARALCRNDHDPDDLTQDTILRALANREKFQPGTNMKSWLFTIMKNLFYSGIKIRGREKPGAEDCVSSSPSVASTQDWSLQGCEVRDCIDKLPSEQREILILIGIQGFSYEEAASFRGCAVGTVKSRLNRARHQVLANLEMKTVSELLQEH
ncbi:sigma-70 family RNA polymerase sigma factor [Amorphus sp. 3PC139-8]|uniref:sigma-70 family RNA polymerase sigma factor n=1 Tax=Amorphus sp. 3PC139-8 TaxID=2735676 RepID=UPI00345CA73C